MGRARLIAAVAALLALAAPAHGARNDLSVSRVTASDLRWSYRPGCPVAPSQLRLVHLPYWGFDGRPHRGALVVNVSVVPAVAHIFGRLYAARFPIRSIEPIDVFRGSDDRSMAADNTSAFNCRYAVAAGPKRWSVHSYGEAIDVDPLENPYLLDRRVYPPAGRPSLDRGRVRPGMAVSGGELVAAFAASGWQWGGRWAGSPDYQHFSSTGG
jgi:D-alanyl-D-alanine carboxypeptidase